MCRMLSTILALTLLRVVLATLGNKQPQISVAKRRNTLFFTHVACIKCAWQRGGIAQGLKLMEDSS